jgi:hypothetical protein
MAFQFTLLALVGATQTRRCSNNCHFYIDK